MERGAKAVINDQQRWHQILLAVNPLKTHPSSNRRYNRDLLCSSQKKLRTFLIILVTALPIQVVCVMRDTDKTWGNTWGESSVLYLVRQTIYAFYGALFLQILYFHDKVCGSVATKSMISVILQTMSFGSKETEKCDGESVINPVKDENYRL